MKQLKRQHQREAKRAAIKRIARTETEFSIEIMSHAFSMFRASEEWQRIGKVGRWFSAWVQLWVLVGRSFRVHAGGVLTLTDAGDAYNFHVGQSVMYSHDPNRGWRVTAIDRQTGTITAVRTSR